MFSSIRTTTLAMLCIFVILHFLPHMYAIDPYQKYTQINLPPQGPTGPEAVALDQFNRGPYISASDGRVLIYKGSTIGFVDFAYVAPNRNKQICDGVTDINLGPTCGRITAFSFDPITGFLYMVDTFFGFAVVGPNGGKATIIATSANGVRFNYLSGCDVNPVTREVIFTDSSLTYNLRDVLQRNFTPDAIGRLMKYNPTTNEVTVILDGLAEANEPAVSHDGSFVLFSETTRKRIMKYRLIEKTTEVFLNLTTNDVVRQPPSVTPFGYKFNLFGQFLLTKNLQGQNT